MKTVRDICLWLGGAGCGSYISGLTHKAEDVNSSLAMCIFFVVGFFISDWYIVIKTESK